MKLVLLVTFIIVVASATSGEVAVTLMVTLASCLIACGVIIGGAARDALVADAAPSASKSRLCWSLRGIFSVTFCLALILASLFHQAPFQIRFALARSAINGLAERAEAGEAVETPCFTGGFIIRQVEVLPRVGAGAAGRIARAPDAKPRVFLWLDPVARVGFARGIAAKEARYFTQRRLDEQWWYVAED